MKGLFQLSRSIKTIRCIFTESFKFRIFSFDRILSPSVSAQSLLITRNYTSNLCNSREINEMAIEKKPFMRLSKDVKPINYKLSLFPDLEKLTFSCNEDIHIEVFSSM